MFQVRYDDDPRWPFLYKIRMFECVKNLLINERKIFVILISQINPSKVVPKLPMY